MCYIRCTVERLIKKYNTRCPFELADHLGIEIFGHPFKKIRGLIFSINNRKIIGIKEDLPLHEKKAIIAHEIGHEQLHPPNAGYFFIKEHTNFTLGKFEREANEFAGMLLIDETPEYGETLKQFARRKNIPEYLVKVVY